jgi:predicted amino acid dehydrogenase
MTSRHQPGAVLEDTFAFIIHPTDPKRDVARKYPALGALPRWLIDYLSLFFPPVHISEIKGVRSSATGNTARGWFVACPLTPKRMVSLPPSVVYRKVIQSCRLGQRLGARIVGLGAFTSVVGDGGQTIADNLTIPVTTGNSYTVATAVSALLAAAEKMEIRSELATLAVVGATGSIGSLCAEMLARKVGKMMLIGRHPDKLQQVAENVRAAGCRHIEATLDVAQAREAQLIMTVTSAVGHIIEPNHLRRGAVVCDVARPRDVSGRVVAQRPDVLVIEGGMVALPGQVDFGFDFGFPAGMAYACMAETMLLSLEQRYESYTLGKVLALSQVITIDRIAAHHGFKLGGFRSFERAVTESELAVIKSRGQSFQSSASHSQGVQSPLERDAILPS